MNVPNLPTDNLYKFMAIFGLIITLFAIYQLNTDYFRLLSKEKDHNFHSYELQYRMQMATWGLHELNKLSTLDSISQATYDKVLEELSKYPNRYLEASDQAEADYNFEYQSWRLRLYFLLSFLLLGFIVMIVGFRLWYYKYQRYVDAKQKWEGERFVELLEEAKGMQVDEQDLSNSENPPEPPESTDQGEPASS